jgi:hypothetical protein
VWGDGGSAVLEPSADADGPKAVEEAMRRASAQREGEPLSEAEWDLYLDAESNVLVSWHTEPEPASRSAVLGCLG